MHVTSVKRIAEHTAEATPICGFVAYIDGEKPILLRRMGSQIASDLHDAFKDQVSTDNGRTWGPPRASLSRVQVEGGYTVFVENATFYSAEKNKLVHLTDQFFLPTLDGPNLNESYAVRITVGSPQEFIEGNAGPPLISQFGLEQGLSISFTHVFEDAAGRLLATVQVPAEDKERRFSNLGYAVREDLPGYMQDVMECRVLIGTWNEDHNLDWQLGGAVPLDIEKSTRGWCEGSLAEVGERLVLVLRGSNAAWPERPGYKWVSYSEDGGLSWSEAVPLACDDGSLLQSSATGCYLFRSLTSGKIYWIGNLCLNGEQANGNFPRSPLVIAEVQEEPFALRRETITVIGDRAEGEDEFVQLSNFRCYQDRETGEAVVCLTRFGERGSGGNDWLVADCYEYRVDLDEGCL